MSSQSISRALAASALGTPRTALAVLSCPDTHPSPTLRSRARLAQSVTPPRPPPPPAPQAVGGGLAQQRSVFEGVTGKVAALSNKFPVVNTLMNAIRRRKNRVRRVRLRRQQALPVLGRRGPGGGGEGGEGCAALVWLACDHSLHNPQRLPPSPGPAAAFNPTLPQPPSFNPAPSVTGQPDSGSSCSRLHAVHPGVLVGGGASVGGGGNPGPPEHAESSWCRVDLLLACRLAAPVRCYDHWRCTVVTGYAVPPAVVQVEQVRPLLDLARATSLPALLPPAHLSPCHRPCLVSMFLFSLFASLASAARHCSHAGMTHLCTTRSHTCDSHAAAQPAAVHSYPASSNSTYLGGLAAFRAPCSTKAI
jgi:hypothetical protein